MSAAVLRSQNYLRDRFRREAGTMTPPVISCRNPNPNPSQYLRRKRSPVGAKSVKRSSSQSMVAKPPAKNLVMGQVKILKRGETLTHVARKSDLRKVGGDTRKQKPMSRSVGEIDLALGSTNRLGPDPETVQRQISIMDFKVANGVYAGSHFLTSPSPSSLPVPGFLSRTVRGAAADN